MYANIVDVHGNNHLYYSGAGIIKANVLQHVALTYDRASGVSCMYRNGALMAEVFLDIFTPQTTGDLYFGLRASDERHPSFFKGIMDEIALYNRALSQEEIMAIFKAGDEGKCLPKVAPGKTE